ncbi:MAG: hypothetical protein VCF24_04615 [Candidatus Latescibacterota bacterium]
MFLVPFCGNAGNRLTLNVDGDTYLAVSRLAGLLEDAVRTSLADKIVDDGVDRLYRDDTYAVVRTPRGRTYVVQRVPPYVVEGIDKKLYYFDGVDIGLLVRACSRVTCSRRSVCRCLRNTVTCSSTVSATTSVCRGTRPTSASLRGCRWPRAFSSISRRRG